MKSNSDNRYDVATSNEWKQRYPRTCVEMSSCRKKEWKKIGTNLDKWNTKSNAWTELTSRRLGISNKLEIENLREQDAMKPEIYVYISNI